MFSIFVFFLDAMTHLHFRCNVFSSRRWFIKWLFYKFPKRFCWHGSCANESITNQLNAHRIDKLCLTWFTLIRDPNTECYNCFVLQRIRVQCALMQTGEFEGLISHPRGCARGTALWIDFKWINIESGCIEMGLNFLFTVFKFYFMLKNDCAVVL